MGETGRQRYECYRRELSRVVSPPAVVVRSVDSTNALARRLLERAVSAPLRLPFLVAAWEQRAGRGRRGRSWASPAGAGVYASLVVEPGDRLARLPLVAPAALALELDRLQGLRCRIKWPNDLMVGERKIGGVLVESVAAPRRAAIVGFGVNYRGAPFGGAATVCASTPEPPGLAALVAVLAGAVRGALERGDGLPGAVERYRALLVHRPGDRLTYRSEGVVREGVFRGLDDRGFLRLEGDGRERLLAAAEVIE